MKEEFLYSEDILQSIKLSDWPYATFKPSLSIEDIGEGLAIRPLKSNDYQKGFPKILSQLTVLGDVSEEQFKATFEKMKRCPDTYYITVIEDTQTEEIIGSATLLVEQKFIRGCAKRGRIEDVVVNNAYRGKQLGKVLIATKAALGKHLQCYKVSLDCRDEMLGFYNSLGFKRDEGNSNFMVHRY